MLEWLRNLLQGLLLHTGKAVVVEEVAAAMVVVVVVIDAETTTEMVGQIGILMVETALVHTDDVHRAF